MLQKGTAMFLPLEQTAEPLWTPTGIEMAPVAEKCPHGNELGLYLVIPHLNSAPFLSSCPLQK